MVDVLLTFFFNQINGCRANVMLCVYTYRYTLSEICLYVAVSRNQTFCCMFRSRTSTEGGTHTCCMGGISGCILDVSYAACMGYALS